MPNLYTKIQHQGTKGLWGDPQPTNAYLMMDAGKPLRWRGHKSFVELKWGESRRLKSRLGSYNVASYGNRCEFIYTGKMPPSFYDKQFIHYFDPITVECRRSRRGAGECFLANPEEAVEVAKKIEEDAWALWDHKKTIVRPVGSKELQFKIGDLDWLDEHAWEQALSTDRLEPRLVDAVLNRFAQTVYKTTIQGDEN